MELYSIITLATEDFESVGFDLPNILSSYSVCVAIFFFSTLIDFGSTAS